MRSSSRWDDVTHGSALHQFRMVASKATIDLVKRAAATDDQYQLLRRQIAVGCPDNMADLPAALREFTTFADELVEVDGLVFKGQRIVVPVDARPEILRRIHSSHIGVNGCIRRAREGVFYPGLTADIKKVVASCAICAASMQKEPLMPHDAPTRPWEKDLLLESAVRSPRPAVGGRY